MNRRFKFVYYYNETEETVHKVNIWDTRMNPKALIKRIRLSIIFDQQCSFSAVLLCESPNDRQQMTQRK